MKKLDIISLSLGIILTAWGQPSQGKQSAIQTFLAAENPIAPLGGRLFVCGLLQNNSEAPIQGVGPLSQNGLRLVGPDGHELPKSKAFLDLLSSPAFRPAFSVDPGKNFVQHMEISKLFALSQMGEYILTGTWSMAPDLSSTVQVKFVIVSQEDKRLSTGPEMGVRSVATLFPDSAPAQMDIQIEPKEISISLHEPIIVNLLLRNIAGSTVEIPFGHAAESNYRVSVLSPKGVRTEIFSVPPPVSLGISSSARIGPGDSHKEPLILSRWFAFEEIGPYQVALFLPQAAAPALVSINVGPRDVRRLEEVTQELLKQAKSTKIEFALTALSSERDAVAVRHLQGFFDSNLAIDVLRGMETEAAVLALRDFTYDRDRVVAGNARAALEHLRREAPTEIVRTAAAQALVTISR